MRDFAAKELDGHLYVMAQHTFETDPDPQPSKPPAVTAAHAGQLETVLVGALIAAAAQTLQYVVPAICVTGAIASKVLQVGVQVVRELYGVVCAHGAAGGYLVSSGTFTAPAADFARDVGLRLIDGPALETMIRRAQQARRAGAQPARELVSPAAPTSRRNVPGVAPPAAAVQAPFYPTCGAPMLTKPARRGPNAGRHFWSCQRYPVCHGTRPA